jgi:hypothetical protein
LPIRRWIAPEPGRLTVTGKLSHPSENGDGVRGRIVSNQAGILGEWSVKTGGADTPLNTISVIAGETIDFIVDGKESVTSDSFDWRVVLTLTAADGTPIDVWNSVSEFHGPVTTPLASQAALAWQLAFQRLPEPAELEFACVFLQQQLRTLATQPDVADRDLTALTSLCQQLLSSNEFLYVD